MTRPAMIVDTETTSLVADYTTGAGVIWELAVIEYPSGTEHLWRMEPDVTLADETALEVGRYHERTKGMQHASGFVAHDLAQMGGNWWSADVAVATVAGQLLDGAILIGANPGFDAAFLAQLFLMFGEKRRWHYRLRDIGSMAWGSLHAQGALTVPALDASTDEFALALHVDPGQFERHSALGDCRLVAAMLAEMDGWADR